MQFHCMFTLQELILNLGTSSYMYIFTLFEEKTLIILITEHSKIIFSIFHCDTVCASFCILTDTSRPLGCSSVTRVLTWLSQASAPCGEKSVHANSCFKLY